MKPVIEVAVNSAIEVLKDNSMYLKTVGNNFTLPEGLIDLLKKHKIDYQLSEHDDFPDVTLFCEFGHYKKDNFQVEYTFELHFSKLAKVYKYLFGFEVQNYDEDESSGGVLDGSGEMPYTKTQYSFKENLDDMLLQSGFVKLSLRDYEEVLLDVNFNSDNLKFFNEQPNVDLLFFNDLRRLYSEIK